MNLGRLIRTLRYLKPSQIYWRARYTIERRTGWQRIPPVPGHVPEWNTDALSRLRDLASHWGALDNRARSRATDFRAGQFVFVNDPADFSSGIDWQSTSRWRLWRYQLHYFDCAKELALAPAAGDAALAHAWILDWMAKNPPVTDVAWDAFTISARMLNWALAAAVFGIEDDAIRASYLHQAHFLSTHLELDVLANHLLKNACALCVAGVLFDHDLLEQGLQLLREQLDEQILPDGGHYERAPMYHALVLEDVLVVQAALGPRGDFLAPYIARMAKFLDGILHPDGEIPFFGDSVLGEARTPAVLLSLAGYERNEDPPQFQLFPDSGYGVMRDGSCRMQLIAKFGMPGPSYQLGHAHADCLSYELSVDGQRVIVNSGVHGYADSPHRAYCRSEAAHNTFEILRRPQLELWGAFRAGRRYAATSAPRLDDFLEETLLHAEFSDGYRHTSTNDPEASTFDIALAPSRYIKPTSFGFDVLSMAFGNGAQLMDRIHLAPDFFWERRGNVFHALKNRVSVLSVQSGCTLLDIEVPASEGAIAPSQYFAEFGRMAPTQCLTFTPGPETVASGYRIRLA